MSKPDLLGNSLEEILASIRKTLSDDRPEDGLSKLNNAPSESKDEAKTEANGHAPKGSDALPNRLADALNGSGNGRAETDLTELLSSEAPRQTEQASSPEDVPWFLKRDPQSGEGNAKPAAASIEIEQPRQTMPEEIALTRPETVRRSFPPLFGGGETLPARQADMPAPSRPSDVLLTPKAAREPVAETPKPAAPVEAKALAAEPVAPTVEKPVLLPEPPATVIPLPREVSVAEARVPYMQDPATMWEEPPLPEPPLPEPLLPEAPKREALSAEPAAAGQSQALQDMIARLLEPVIQKWLETNLPSMVDAAIREEMQRQIKRPRGELKI